MEPGGLGADPFGSENKGGGSEDEHAPRPTLRAAALSFGLLVAAGLARGLAVDEAVLQRAVLGRLSRRAPPP